MHPLKATVAITALAMTGMAGEAVAAVSWVDGEYLVSGKGITTQEEANAIHFSGDVTLIKKSPDLYAGLIGDAGSKTDEALSFDGQNQSAVFSTEGDTRGVGGVIGSVNNPVRFLNFRDLTFKANTGNVINGTQLNIGQSGASIDTLNILTHEKSGANYAWIVYGKYDGNEWQKATSQVYSKTVNIGAFDNPARYGVSAANKGTLYVESEQTRIYSKGAAINAQKDTKLTIRARKADGSGQLGLYTNDITLHASGGTLELDADKLEVVSSYEDSPAARNLALFAYNGATVDIKADTATFSTVNNATGENDANAFVLNSTAGSNVSITTRKSLTINGGIGSALSNTDGETYPGSSLTLTADGGRMTVNGDIQSVNSYEAGESFNHQRINLVARSGAIVETHGEIRDNGTSGVGGVSIELADSTWNVGGMKNNLNTITGDHALINNHVDAQIQVGELKTEQGSMTTYNTGSATEGQLKIGKKEGGLTVLLDSRGVDELGGSSAAEAAGKLAAIAEVESGDKAVTYATEEGSVIGKMEVKTDASGNITRVSEAKNTVTDSLQKIGAMNFLSFRAQTNDVSRRMGDLRTMPQADGAWARAIAGQSEYK
ncbi:hypothetical protein, partial [Oxalobacter paraformigenes]